jgi:hypothetical protein
MIQEFASLLESWKSDDSTGTFGLSIPGLEIDPLWYYVFCAVAFTLAGLITGSFIWKKGAMQTHDAETEIKRTSDELKRLAEDLKIEESVL